MLEIRRSPVHGHGCFAARAIGAGEVIARTRMLVLAPEETELVQRTSLKHFIFYVKDGPQADGPFHSALALGPVSFCNHSADANCSFVVDEAASELVLTARLQIGAGEEITIDYGDYAQEII